MFAAIVTHVVACVQTSLAYGDTLNAHTRELVRALSDAMREPAHTHLYAALVCIF